MSDKWVIIEIVDDRILQCLVTPTNLMLGPKQNAIDCAVDLAMENGYDHGRNDAADILNNDGRLFVGTWAVHIALPKDNELPTPRQEQQDTGKSINEGDMLRVVEVNTQFFPGILHAGTVSVEDRDGDMITLDLETDGLPKSYKHSTSDV